MPIKKSAVKRAKQSIGRRSKNRALKATFRNAVKDVLQDAKAKDTKDIAKKTSVAIQAIDKAAKNNAIHKNTAARKKSNMMKAANAASAKPIRPGRVKIKQKNTSNPSKSKASKKSTPKKK